MSKEIIFEDKAEVSVAHVGTAFQTEYKKDKFGYIGVGRERNLMIRTKYGQLNLPPYKYGNKIIKVTIEIIEGDLK